MSDRKPPDDPVAEFIRDSDGMPNQREALPPGTLPGTFADPQGDENRDPPCRPTPPPVFPAEAHNSVTATGVEKRPAAPSFRPAPSREAASEGSNP